jgi:hypothetical protein
MDFEVIRQEMLMKGSIGIKLEQPSCGSPHIKVKDFMYETPSPSEVSEKSTQEQTPEAPKESSKLRDIMFRRRLSIVNRSTGRQGPAKHSQSYLPSDSIPRYVSTHRKLGKAANNSDLQHIVNHSQNPPLKPLAPIRPFPLDLSSPTPSLKAPPPSLNTHTTLHPSFGTVAPTASPSGPQTPPPPLVDEEANFTRVLSQDFLRLSLPQPVTDLEK